MSVGARTLSPWLDKCPFANCTADAPVALCKLTVWPNRVLAEARTRKLARMIGGDVTVASEAGKGSVFTVQKSAAV
jgi:hypothetical protein